MSDTVKQTPLGINVLGSLFASNTIRYNPVMVGWVGTSDGYNAAAGYIDGGPYTPGNIVENTVLRMLTYSINRAYRGATVDGTVSNSTYNSMISIGVGTIGAFGNSKPNTYTNNVASGPWGVGTATNGNPWAPEGWGGPDDYTRTIATNPPRPISAWGFSRLLALQAVNEFNYNNSLPQYGDWLYSYQTTAGWRDSINTAIVAADRSKTWGEGVYTNMDDTITADITAVNLATVLWGGDLIALGSALDTSTIDTWGLPSNLLRLLVKNSALTESVVIALLASGISAEEIDKLTSGAVATQQQEASMWAAFRVIVGLDLQNILITLNTTTAGLNSLADLLDPQKIFPSSWQSLTVPVYNSVGGASNVRSYIPLYVGGGTNPALYSINNVERSSTASGVAPSETNTLTSIAALPVLNQLSTNPSTGTPTGVPVTPVLSMSELAASAAVAAISGVSTAPSAASIASRDNSSAFRNDASLLNGVNRPTVAATSTVNTLNSGFGWYLAGIMPQQLATVCGAFSVAMQNIKNITNIPLEKFATVVANLETTRGLDVGAGSVPTNSTLADTAIAALGSGSGLDSKYTVSDHYGCMSGLPYNHHWETIAPLLEDATIGVIYREMYLATTWRGAILTVQFTTGPGPTYTITGITITNPGGGYGRGSAVAPTITIGGGSGATATCTIETNPSNISTFGSVTSVTLTSAGVATGTIPTITIEAPPTVAPGLIGPVVPTGYTNTPDGTVGWPAMDAVVANYIAQANARIAAIQTADPVRAQTLNTAWDAIGEQLNREQVARSAALYPLTIPKVATEPLSVSPQTQTGWVDSLRSWADDVEPNGHAATLEAIADWATIGGQSLVALLRAERNRARLQLVGIPLDDAIPDDDTSLNNSDTKSYIGNGPTVGTGSCVHPTVETALQVSPTISSSAAGYYDSNTNNYVITTTTLQTNGTINQPTGLATTPGSIASSPYANIILPNYNVLLSSRQLTPSVYTVSDALQVLARKNS